MCLRARVVESGEALVLTEVVVGSGRVQLAEQEDARVGIVGDVARKRRDALQVVV